MGHPLSQRVHVNHGGTLPRRLPSVAAQDVGPGSVHVGREWQSQWRQQSMSSRFSTLWPNRLNGPQGSIVLTGDTQPCQTVVELVRSADMMLCMCWND